MFRHLHTYTSRNCKPTTITICHARKIYSNINTFIATSLPKCSFCGEMSRPNVSMFGDVEFYGKPYQHQRRRLNEWLDNIKKNDKSLVILEIGCGINPHSLRMNDGKMMSGEWKMPIFDNNIGIPNQWGLTCLLASINVKTFDSLLFLLNFFFFHLIILYLKIKF